eukprot:CAMPEP_0181519672 /NCGR_PEP_ID=MMETSP1110-20121109/65908_1 /TAXON_ID=174948 /ORGANISM="Symbiodinium sp., Strain CCMP421" /LENGTH=103 /DNA_ID=CAMNT_0023650123 /DNA_START=238 /DNA_END=546 /DNA_ORIENTATION=+
MDGKSGDGPGLPKEWDTVPDGLALRWSAKAAPCAEHGEAGDLFNLMSLLPFPWSRTWKKSLCLSRKPLSFPKPIPPCNHAGSMASSCMSQEPVGLDARCATKW